MLKKILVFVLLISAASFAQNANDLLKSIQNKYNGINDFSATFSQTTGGKNFAGKVFYKKVNKYRVEMNNMVITSDGQNVWNYNKKDKKVVVSSYNAQDPSVFSMNTVLFDLPSKSNLSVEKEGNKQVLVLAPKQKSNYQFSKIKIFVEDNYLIDRVKIEKQGSSLNINLSDYQLNKNLANSEFSFTPPKGSNIVDLR